MLPNGFHSHPDPTLSNDARPSVPSAKLIVTRRSWLADSSKLPFRRERSDESEPRTAIGLGDVVDSGTPAKFPLAVGPEEVIEGITESGLSDADLREFLRIHGFRPHQIVFFIISVGTYVSDIASDAYLAYSYYQQGDYYWSSLTLALLLVPALVMTAFSLAWYVLDRKVNVDPPRSCRAWFLRLFFHGLQLAPIVRLADAIYYGIASRKAELSLSMAVHYTQLMLYEDADSAMLRMMECFMEAAPQLLLQLYIIFTQSTPEHTFQYVAQITSCFTSWISLAWSLTHYQSALRSSRAEKSNLNWVGSALFLGWKAGMLASRILALSLLAALVRGLVFSLAIGFHWAVAVGWLITRGTTFCSPNPRTITEVLFDAVLGFVYCFDVVNVREGHSRLWYLSCYTVIGLENLLVAIFWSLVSLRSGPTPRFMWTWWERPPNMSSWLQDVPGWVLPVSIVGAYGFGLAMMLLYYMFAHPSRNIKLWIPCDILLRCDESEPQDEETSRDNQTDTSAPVV